MHTVELLLLSKDNIPLSTDMTDFMVDYANARWMCPVCAETHCPKTGLQDRIFTLAGMEGITNDPLAWWR